MRQNSIAPTTSESKKRDPRAPLSLKVAVCFAYFSAASYISSTYSQLIRFSKKALR
jgi:hypothetical protein